jgi:hypothetical protein
VKINRFTSKQIQSSHNEGAMQNLVSKMLHCYLYLSNFRIGQQPHFSLALHEMAILVAQGYQELTLGQTHHQPQLLTHLICFQR